MRANVVRACVALSVMSGGIASGALAQPSLDRAEEQLELAEFEEAARILEEVVGDAGAGLDRDAVARLYSLRAVVRSALGRDRDVGRDLAALVTVLDGREPGALPSGLQRRYERLRRQLGDAPLRVRLRIRPVGDHDVSARLSIDDDPGDVVRRTELVCRSGSRDLASSDSGRVTVRGAISLECEGRAFGPGGWEAGRSTARWRSGEGPGEIPEPGPVGIDEALLLALAGAGAAVVLAVLVAVIAYAASSTGVSGPLWMMRE